MIKFLLTKTGITGLINKVRVGGETIPSTLRVTRNNTKRALKALWRIAVRNDLDPETFSLRLDSVINTRKRQVLTTLKNIMTAVRGQVRNAVRTERSGRWVNNGVLDGNTTDICIQHMGREWRMAYADIPNRPPRVPPIHRCRSFLRWVADSEQYTPEPPFMDQFNGDEDLQRDLLGKTRFEAFQRGELTINTFGQFEAAVLNTLDDLGI